MVLVQGFFVGRLKGSRHRRVRLAVLVATLLTAGLAWADDDGGAMIASGAGVSLSERDFRKEVLLLEPAVRERLAVDRQQAATLVNSLLRLQAISNEAERHGVYADPMVQLRIRRATQQIVAEALRERIVGQAEEPDFVALAQQEYRVNPERFATGEQVRARHILLRVESPDELDAKRRQLEEIAARVSGGESFEALARTYSDDTGSRESGGDLGLFGRNRMVKPFEDAAFALNEPGEVSEIVETRFGLHLIQLVERTPGERREFDEVRDILVSQLRVRYLRDYLSAWERDLLESSSVTVDIEKLERVLQELRRESHEGDGG